MEKFNKTEVAALIDRMADLYPEAECALVHEDPFQLLIAVVLSAQTTDASVNRVSSVLFERYPDAFTLAEGRQEDLEEILRRIGMYRTKARNIIALSRILVEQYDGKVPGDYEKLTALPGVGRKTANVVLSVGFGEPRIAVDTHVFRLANRIGITAEKNVLKTELALMEAIPKERWVMMHHALIWHGRRVCSARNPKCQQCGVNTLCRRNALEAKK